MNIANPEIDFLNKGIISFFKESEDPFFIFNNQGNIIFANKAFHNALEYTDHSLQNSSIFKLLEGSQHEVFRKKTNSVSREINKSLIESYFISKHGLYKKFQWNINTIEESPNYFFSIPRMVANIEKENNQIGSKEVFDIFNESITDGVMYIYDRNKILFINKTFCRMFDVEEEKISGEDIYDFFKNNNLEFQNKEIKSIEEINEDENLIYTTPEKVRNLSLNIKRLSDNNLSEDDYILYFKDVSDQKLKLQKLEEKNQELNSFIYKVSHDLKAPLASIYGLLNISKIEGSSDTINNYLGLIEKCVTRLDTILVDLLELAKIQEGETEKANINFINLTQEIMDSFKHLNECKNIVFNTNIDPTLQIFAEKTLISTILQNILINAIKYHNPEIPSPYVNIDICRDENGFIKIQISDNGTGIDEILKNRVFDMFFRANQNTEGSGLGLYIVKNAVEKLGGKIKLDSQKGIGTTFTLELPLI